jgi:uncharacterized protein YgbK (DUF1537 family)
MLLGCIADDFTGASDLANTLAKGGMRTVQFCGIPNRPVSACEAGVVALKTRSIPAADAVTQSLAALEWLKGQGCRQFLFKYCSTFDSTPKGNIGPVAQALMETLDTQVAVVCPAFPATGRTIYMGHMFVGDRLLNESGMQDHPLTPMTDADIRRWLSRQTSLPVDLISYPAVVAGTESIKNALQAFEDGKRRLIVVDATDDRDLVAIGRALADHRLITGGSGIALGLPENFRRAGLVSGNKADFQQVRGAGAILSGSCSKTSRNQVEHYRRRHPSFEIDVSALLSGTITVATAADFMASHMGKAPIVYSTADPDKVRDVQAAFGRERTADAIEAFFGTLAVEIVGAGIRRLVVSGGETSGAVVNSLRLGELLIGPEIDPGVPALKPGRDDLDIRIALKSGNFGRPEFFEDALEVLGQP